MKLIPFFIALLALIPTASQARCLFVGDSIALGAGRAYNAKYWANCEIKAKVGASSRAVVRQFKPRGHYDFVVVSIGSNNPMDKRLKSDVQTLNEINATRIVWLLPYHRQAAQTVRANAAGYFVSLNKFKTRDGVHPNYAPLARHIQKIK